MSQTNRELRQPQLLFAIVEECVEGSAARAIEKINPTPSRVMSSAAPRQRSFLTIFIVSLQVHLALQKRGTNSNTVNLTALLASGMLTSPRGTGSEFHRYSQLECGLT